ncbi:MAG: hypothetical protein Q4A86_01110 [Clostridia bacterium]|nr:hypothetical protein [Clostridia bacterium]
MKRGLSKFKVAAVVLCMVSAFTVVLAEPGGTDDPLISKSYIETVLMPQIKEYVETKISQINSGSGTHTAESFKVVDMKAGQKMICDAGAELILRMGKADIIATEKGGLADTTAGFDLANGSDMPSNHLLIVPLGDGRGIEAKNDVIVMVKGGYTIN